MNYFLNFVAVGLQASRGLRCQGGAVAAVRLDAQLALLSSRLRSALPLADFYFLFFFFYKYVFLSAYILPLA